MTRREFWLPSPITFLRPQNRGAVIQALPAAVEGKIMPDSYVSSMGSAFTETGYPPTADRGERTQCEILG